MKQLLILFLLFACGAEAQVSLGSGYYSSETKCFSEGNHFYLLRKKYLLDDTIPGPGYKPETSYLNLPVSAEKALLFGKAFRTELVCLDRHGKVNWTHAAGTSMQSNPTGCYISKADGIFLGESIAQDSIHVERLDSNGKVLWTFFADSLENVHDILCFRDTVHVLASFNWTKRIKSGSSMTLVSGYAYHLLRLRKSDGKLIDDIFERYSTYYGERGFEDPQIGDGGVLYIYRGDTLIYLKPYTSSALLLSAKQIRDNQILNLASRPGEYEALAKTSKGQYQYLVSHFGTAPLIDTLLMFSLPRNYRQSFLLHRDSLGYAVLFADAFQLKLQRWDKTVKALPSFEVRLEALKSDWISSACLEPDGSVDVVSVIRSNRRNEFFLHHIGADGRTLK